MHGDLSPETPLIVIASEHSERGNPEKYLEVLKYLEALKVLDGHVANAPRHDVTEQCCAGNSAGIIYKREFRSIH